MWAKSQVEAMVAVVGGFFKSDGRRFEPCRTRIYAPMRAGPVKHPCVIVPVAVWCRRAEGSFVGFPRSGRWRPGRGRCQGWSARSPRRRSG
jgi:hypothetical protein